VYEGSLRIDDDDEEGLTSLLRPRSRANSFDPSASIYIDASSDDGSSNEQGEDAIVVANLMPPPPTS